MRRGIEVEEEDQSVLEAEQTNHRLPSGRECHVTSPCRAGASVLHLPPKDMSAPPLHRQKAPISTDPDSSLVCSQLLRWLLRPGPMPTHPRPTLKQLSRWPAQAHLTASVKSRNPHLVHLQLKQYSSFSQYCKTAMPKAPACLKQMLWLDHLTASETTVITVALGKLTIWQSPQQCSYWPGCVFPAQIIKLLGGIQWRIQWNPVMLDFYCSPTGAALTQKLSNMSKCCIMTCMEYNDTSERQ